MSVRSVPTDQPGNDHLDEVDGLPVSVRTPGAPLAGDVLAWERLGVGQRCETWLGWSCRLWSPAVVKLPRPHQTTHPRARQTLRREVAALGGNLHPGLPRLLDDGTGTPEPYIVVEYLDGTTLDVEVDDAGPFAADDVAVLGAQVVSALLVLHARGLAHLDLKPDNIALCHGRPILLDFGSARRLGAEQPPGRPVGSPGYAAPELEAGRPIDAAMDLYGLGATLHELLTGAPAFDPGLDAGVRPPAPSLPESSLSATVLSMLEPDPARRPGLRAVLRAFGRAAVAAGREPWPSWADARLDASPRPGGSVG